MWLCPTTTPPLGFWRGKHDEAGSPCQVPCQGQAMGHTLQLALSLLSLLLSSCCPTAVPQFLGSSCPTKGNARGSLKEGWAGDSQGQAELLSLVWDLALFLALHLWGLGFYLYR